jgi:hypothetical protein
MEEETNTPRKTYICPLYHMRNGLDWEWNLGPQRLQVLDLTAEL